MEDEESFLLPELFSVGSCSLQRASEQSWTIAIVVTDQIVVAPSSMQSAKLFRDALKLVLSGYPDDAASLINSAEQPRDWHFVYSAKTQSQEAAVNFASGSLYALVPASRMQQVLVDLDTVFAEMASRMH